MAQSLSQAYDYWQDQPGSYFSTPPLRTGPRRYTASRKMPFPTVVHRNPFKPRDGRPRFPSFDVLDGVTHVTRSPRTHDLTSLRNASPRPWTKITPFEGDYRRRASPTTSCPPSRWIPKQST